MKPDLYIYIYIFFKATQCRKQFNLPTARCVGTVLFKSGSCVSGWYDESNLVGYACSKAIWMVFGLLWCLGTSSNRLQHGDGAQKCHPWRLYWCVDCLFLQVTAVWMYLLYVEICVESSFKEVVRLVLNGWCGYGEFLFNLQPWGYSLENCLPSSGIKNFFFFPDAAATTSRKIPRPPVWLPLLPSLQSAPPFF